MSFHLGKPILVMIVIAAVTGTAIALRSRERKRADLVLWVFADSHAKTYRGSGLPGEPPSLVEKFRKMHGLTVDIQLLSYRAENVRLVSMFMSDMKGPVVPDVVEIEIGQVGRFFRPPVNEVGLLPLNDFLKESGWMDRIVKTRFAPWSKEGVIFGVPHDVHPVTITYRDDLFREAGVDLSAAKTWYEFHEMCLRFRDYWRKRGFYHRHALELPVSDASYLLVMLLQRHINPIDDYGRIHLDNPKVAQTVAFYAQLVAGPRKIATQSPGVEGAASKDLNEGNICAYITPDWRVKTLKDYTETDPATGRKKLEGKMRMMPLPIFEPGDARTATWGGTMMGIPRTCPRPREAWKLIEYLYLSEDGLRARLRETNILPPVKDQWNEPEYQREDPYFGGQKVDRLFVELAHEIPARYVNPATTFAAMALSNVMDKARLHVESRGPEGLEERCRQWLKDAADDLDVRIRQASFEQ